MKIIQLRDLEGKTPLDVAVSSRYVITHPQIARKDPSSRCEGGCFGHTIVFADGYEEWAPVNKVQELQWCIKTPEVRIMSFVERMRQRAQGLAVPSKEERAAAVSSAQWKNGIVPPIFPTPAWERLQKKKAERRAAAQAAKAAKAAEAAANVAA